jgi:hypothetical protein
MAASSAVINTPIIKKVCVKPDYHPFALVDRAVRFFVSVVLIRILISCALRFTVIIAGERQNSKNRAEVQFAFLM